MAAFNGSSIGRVRHRELVRKLEGLVALGLMRTMVVVKVRIVDSNVIQMLQSETPEMIESLLSEPPDPGFGKGVGIGTRYRRFHDLDATRPEGSIESAVELETGCRCHEG